MKKRIVALILVAAMLAACVPMAAVADTVLVYGDRYPIGDLDMSGKVDTADAVLILQVAAGIYQGNLGEENLLDYEWELADVNADGSIGAADAVLVLQYAATLISKFPGESSYQPDSEEAGKTFAALSDIPENAPAEVTDATHAFGYFALSAERNANLPFNMACHVTDTAITALLPAGVDLSGMVVDFTYYGDKVLFNGQPVTSDTVFDFSYPVTLTKVARDGSTESVTVEIETLNTGLPSMAVTQLNYAGCEKIDHDIYSQATIYLGGGNKNVCSYAPDAAQLVTGNIKGRGNSSWLLDDKKSYTIKLDKKAQFLDMDKSKNWAIVANYEDKSLMRNTMAAYFADAANVPYVMQARPVDMWIDGEYWGTYNLTQKIEIEKDRVSITDIKKPTDEKFEDLAADKVGYLIEFDAHVTEMNAGGSDARGFNPEDYWQEKGKTYWEALGWSRWEYQYPNPYNGNEMRTGQVYYNPDTDETFFQVPNCSDKWATVKKPSTANLEHNPAMREYIFKKVMELDGAIARADYDNSWQNLLDVDSFARWAIVEELMDNTDCSFHSSVYVSLDVGGKFTFGPVWDFDRSSGNCDYWHNHVGSLVSNRDYWSGRVFNTEAGRAALKNAWAELKTNTADWQTELERQRTMLKKSSTINFARWDILGKEVYPNPTAITNITTYQGQVDYLRNWLSSRYSAMDNYIQNR